jgi:hypothetical protein
LTARYAKDIGIDMNAPDATMLFMADRPALFEFRRKERS